MGAGDRREHARPQVTAVLTTPCGECLCCQAGKRCARMLMLSPKDNKALARVARIAGPNPGERTIDLRPRAIVEERRRHTEEPTIVAKCSRCGDDMKVLAFIAHSMKLRGISLPP